jgi:hypothetical protein
MKRDPGKLTVQLALSTALLAASCGGGGGGGVSTFSATATAHAVDEAFVPVVVGDLSAYRVIELDQGPLGTDLNDDGLADAKVTLGLSLLNGATKSTNLEADEVFILGEQFFLVVDEIKNGVDYNGDSAIADLVLMHWTMEELIEPVYVEDVERTALIKGAMTSERFYFVTPSAVGIGSTNICFVDAIMPQLSIRVGGPGSGLDSCRIFGEKQDLLLLTIDENVDGDLDGDGDGMDSFVLALFDGTDIAGNVTLTSLTLRDGDAGQFQVGFDAEALDVSDDGVADEGWLIGVLVDEIAEDADLNDPALFTGGWLPVQCTGLSALADGDKIDQVLHYIYFGHPTFSMDPVNTGLVGSSRVLVLDGEYVATVSAEGDANCDLNSDTDTGDLMPRWCKAIDPALGSMGILPPHASSLMDAVVISPSGGSLGLVELSGNLVALVSESFDNEDHDGDGFFTHNLIAYIDDLDTDGAWEYSLLDPEGGNAEVGASWLGAEAIIDRIAVGLEESVADLNLNKGCNGVEKDSDKADSVAAWLHFEPGGLGIPGIGFAVEEFNMGGTFAGGNMFFALSEAGDDRDYNDNNTKTDTILTRNPVGSSGCAPTAIGTLLISSSDRPALISDNTRGGVFLTDEQDALVDVNKDGDADDIVLRWMRFF